LGKTEIPRKTDFSIGAFFAAQLIYIKAKKREKILIRNAKKRPTRKTKKRKKLKAKKFKF